MLLALLLPPGPAAAQSNDPAPAAPAAEKARTGVVVLPVVFTMPETKLGAGVGGLLTFRPAGSVASSRPSSVYFIAVYTQRKQFSIEAKPELYFRRERYLATGDVIFERYPNKYWGVGNDALAAAVQDYTPRTMSADLSFQRKLLPARKMYAGLFVRYERITMLKTDPGGSLAAGTVPGSRGGTTAGAGVILNWDSRDNVFYPRAGHYFQVKAVAHGKFLGGEYAFNLLDVDLRKYLSLPKRAVLALQAVVQTYTGTAPFYRMARLGGDATMRGYYKGRYRDRSLLAVQSEVRFPVLWRFSGVVFGGLGQVADGLGRLRAGAFKPSVGFGLRFLIVPREGTNIRVDQAYGLDSSGFYFNAGEAF